MTITHRKRLQLPDEVQVINEPGLQIQCDSCMCDLTHSIRIKCADPVCEAGDGVDICPGCFCEGKEFMKHKRGHKYRVVELHSYPIFAEDWGADEELLLIEGIAIQGIGNWQAVAEHVGTRTKEEVEEHYNGVYINSPDWPRPNMNLHFDVDPSLFHERKRRRISTMNNLPAGPKPAPTSAPGVHEIATFLPGRLEFEHELDNDAEDLVKDLEFGVVLEHGGTDIPLDETDVDVRARAKLEEEKRKGKVRDASVDSMAMDVTPGLSNGHEAANGFVDVKDIKDKLKEGKLKEGKRKEEAQGMGEAAGDGEEPVLPPPYETSESVEFKLALLEMYCQRVEKRIENKLIMFDRGLLEYKKIQALEKKRPKDEKDIAHRLRPLAKLQTAEDYETFLEGILYESILRRRIQELQHYRRMGLRTAQDIEKYDMDLSKRNQAKASLGPGERLQLRAGTNRASSGPDPRRQSFASVNESEAGAESSNRLAVPGSNPAPLFRKQPTPLNLANSPSLHLLTPAEQTLCSSLRILPRPYLVIKETLVREYARRGGKLRRREARDLIKIDVNKTSRVWDYLHEAGLLRASLENDANADASMTNTVAQLVPFNSPSKDFSFQPQRTALPLPPPQPMQPSHAPSISQPQSSWQPT